MFRDRMFLGHAVVVAFFVATASGVGAAPPAPTVTLEGHVASVTPAGDVHVRENQGTIHQNPRALAAHEENDNWEKSRSDRRSGCELTTGNVLACATSAGGDTPPTCTELDRQCDFSIELPVGESAVTGLVFVQDENEDGIPDGPDPVAALIDADEGAQVCSGDVVRADDVDIDFAEAAPSAAAIAKVTDTCASS